METDLRLSWIRDISKGCQGYEKYGKQIKNILAPLNIFKTTSLTYIVYR